MECNHLYCTWIYGNENPKSVLYSMQFIYPYIGVFMVGGLRFGKEYKRKKKRTVCFIFLQIHSQWVINLRETWLHHGHTLITLQPPPLLMLLRSANWSASKFRSRIQLDAKMICLFVFHITYTSHITHEKLNCCDAFSAAIWKTNFSFCQINRMFSCISCTRARFANVYLYWRCFNYLFISLAHTAKNFRSPTLGSIERKKKHSLEIGIQSVRNARNKTRKFVVLHFPCTSGQQTAMNV